MSSAKLATLLTYEPNRLNVGNLLPPQLHCSHSNITHVQMLTKETKMAKRERRLMATCETPDLHPLSGQLIRDVTSQPAYFLGLPIRTL